jgi:hypothetical protein
LSIIGVYIKPVPVGFGSRLYPPPAAGMDRVLAQLAYRHPHEHSSLSEIQRWAGLADGTALFESFIVFENFPRAFSLDRRHHDLAITDVRFRIDEHFPLVVVVDPGPRLAIQIKYDAGRFDERSIAAALQGLGMILRAFTTAEAGATVGGVREAFDRFLREDERRTEVDRQQANVRRLRDLKGRASRVPFEASGDDS